MKYEVIIFDADQTLFDFKKSEKKALENTMFDFEIEYDEKHHLKIYKDINSKMWKEFEEGKITQKKLKTERFRRLSEKLGIKFDEKEFADKYMDNLSQASYVYEESEPLLKEIHGERIMSIVTNGLKVVQDGRIRKSQIAHYFQDIVVSEEVQIAKPDSRIFQLALDNLKYEDKKKVLVVGDSLSSDIKGGINFGIDTCWYNPDDTKNESGIEPTYEIRELRELLDII